MVPFDHLRDELFPVSDGGETAPLFGRTFAGTLSPSMLPIMNLPVCG
jgi:hypothetical protein